MKVIVLLYVTFFAFIDATTNYCDPKLCAKGVNHIGCNNNGSFASICVNPKLISMTTAVKTTILDAHNTYRNSFAGGEYKPFKKAAKMAKITWCTDLSMLAELNCKRCTFQHDRCHNTNKYPRSGQNLATFWSSEKFTAAHIVPNIKFAIQSWFNEYKVCPIQIMNKFDRLDSAVIGHFTIMVNERVIRVGCALCQYDKEKYNYLYFVCNYSYNNIIGEQVYTPGETCEMCKGKCSKQYRNLCDE